MTEHAYEPARQEAPYMCLCGNAYRTREEVREARQAPGAGAVGVAAAVHRAGRCGAAGQDWVQEEGGVIDHGKAHGSMTEDDLRAIEARADKATPGPWEREHGIIWSEGGRAKVAYSGALTHDVATLAFIAAARTDVPVLVAEVRRLRALAAELAATLTLEDCTDLDCDYEDCQAIRDALAKAREAGLLEAQA